MKKKIIFGCLGMLVFAFLAIPRTTIEATGGSVPPWPKIYTGNVTVAGQPASDGWEIVGKIGQYVSIPVTIRDGRMVGLAVGPPDNTFFGSTVTFELRHGEMSVTAEQTDLFTNLVAPTLVKDFHLEFPAFPTPTPLPTATPTVTPIPTATPLATATPISVGPIVYSGMIVASGGAVPEGSSLNARIDDYSSEAVEVSNGQFISLIIDLDDPTYTGAEVTFYLDGIKARTTAKYEVGSTIRNIDLIFMDLPDAPTSTPVPSEAPRYADGPPPKRRRR